MSRRPTGRAKSPAQRMRLMRAWRRAQGLKAVVTWVDPHAPLPSPAKRRHEARQLAMHVMHVEKINRDPGLLAIVHHNFDQWQDRERVTPGYAVRLWRATLRLPWPQIAALLTEQSERGIQLRSVAPFFGVLSARERQRIFAAFQLVADPLRRKKRLKSFP